MVRCWWSFFPLSLLAATVFPALPNPPTDLVASEVTGSSVKLSWIAPSGESVESYVIQYRRKDAMLGLNMNEVKDIWATEYVVRHLSPFVMFEFYVSAVNNIGRGVPSFPLNVLTGESGWINQFYYIHKHI